MDLNVFACEGNPPSRSWSTARHRALRKSMPAPIPKVARTYSGVRVDPSQGSGEAMVSRVPTVRQMPRDPHNGSWIDIFERLLSSYRRREIGPFLVDHFSDRIAIPI